MILSDRSLLSLSTLCLSEGADPALPAGSHLRWHLTTDLGYPHAGFRVRSRPASKWPWSSSECEVAWFEGPGRIATSVAGVHVINSPLRAENAIVTERNHLRCSSRSTPINFVYEQRERTDPVFQPWVRFAVLLEAREANSSSIIRLKGFATRNGTRVEVAAMSGRFNLLPSAPSELKNHPVLFIGHGEIDLVTLQASDDIRIVGVLYTTVNFFDRLDDWKTLGVLGPLCDADTANVLAPEDAWSLARARLKNMRPLRRVTEPLTGGRGRMLASEEDHKVFETQFSEEVLQWTHLMTQAFKLEINNRRPPGSITVNELDESPIVHGHPDSELEIPFYGLIQAASFEPHLAAILGVGYFDEDGADGNARDYAVDAVISTLWLRYGLHTVVARDQYDLQQIPENLIAHGRGADVWTGLSRRLQPFFQRLASFAVDIIAEHADPIPPPLLHARQFPDTTLSPVQARVELTVSSSASGTRPLVWRAKPPATEQIEVDFSPTDMVSGQLVPVLPNEWGYVNIHDGQLTSYGMTDYGAINVDAFGRASVVTKASITLQDRVPPPAPGMPEVTLGEPDSANPDLFRASEVSFLWSDGAAVTAPDVIEFTISFKAGSHPPEEVFRNPDGVRTIEWNQADEGALLIETLILPTEHVNYRREVTVVCTAKDKAGNVSPTSPPGLGIRIDEIKVPAPVQPEEPQWSSWPDAKGEVRWRCRWEVPADVQATRLLTASETRILSLSGVDRAAHFSLPSAARAAALKTLAQTTPNAFVPSELALPASIDHADVVMKAGGQDWRVAVIEFIGATGQKADWPNRDDAFAVIRPRGLDLLPPPVLRINLEDRIAIFTAEASIPGRVEIFSVAHPDLIEAATVLGPVAKVVVPGDEDEDTASVDLREWQSDWVGFAAWLWADDGRRSELSPVLWRRLNK